MTKKDKANLAISILETKYPDAKCSLNYNHDKPYELLIATMLSAQCTDKRVNIVTIDLFAKFSSLQSFADADIADIEKIIYPCGFYKTKAKNIKSTATALIKDYQGNLPNTINKLTAFDGVGLKTANLIMGDIFGEPSVVCDTHCIRITNRLGLSTTKDSKKVYLELKEILPPTKSGDFCHRLVLFGRDTCKSQNPICGNCELIDLCEKK